MRRIYYLLIAVFSVSIACFIFTIVMFSIKNNDFEILYRKYYSADVYDTYSVDSKIDIQKLKYYIKRIKVLEGDNRVKLALVKDVEIYYGNDIIIGIQEGERTYCYYTNKSQNISGIAKMPFGLYDLVMTRINAEMEKWLSDLSYIDQRIKELTDKFDEMTFEERKEATEKLLKELKKEGYIKHYSYSEKEYSYEEKGGSLGGIVLEEPWAGYGIPVDSVN